MIKKILCLLIVAVLCIGALVSCNIGGKDDENDSQSTPAADVNDESESLSEGDGKAPLIELPSVKYDNYEYRILARSSYYNSDFEADENTTDTVGQQVYKRNSYIMSTYGVNLTTDYFAQSGRDKGNVSDDKVTSTLATGQDIYSLVATHGRYATSYAINDYCLDWNDKAELPYFNLDYEWWSQGARECFTINDTLYFMVGDLAHMSAAASYCVMANVKALTAAGIDVPYEDVKNGSWTFDKMANYAKTAAVDNGDGKWELNVDTMGYVTNFWGGTYCAFFSSGARIVQNDPNGNPYVSIYDNGATTDTVLRNFFDLVNDQKAAQVEGPNYKALIQNETYVFMDIVLDNIADKVKGVESDIEYAILPYPKTSETVEGYVSHTAGEYDVVIIPKTVKSESREAVCVVTEALSQKGRELVVPVYYDTVVCGRTLQSSKDKEMIKIIEDSRIYDFGYYYAAIDNGVGGGNAGISNLLYKLAKNNFDKGEGATPFASYYATASSVANENLKTLQAAYTK